MSLKFSEFFFCILHELAQTCKVLTGIWSVILHVHTHAKCALFNNDRADLAEVQS